MVFHGFCSVTDGEIKKEKEKARRLRHTSWWDRKISQGICYYCNSNVGRDKLTMDHVVPLSRGGKSKKGNLVPACKRCNNKKKGMLPVEWNEYLDRLSGSKTFDSVKSALSDPECSGRY